MTLSHDQRSMELLLAHKRVLELMAKNTSLKEILTAIAEVAEKFSPGCRAAVYFVTEGKLLLGAAPSFTNAFTEVVDGCPIGENRGVCGHAGFTGERTISKDVANDPVWGSFTEWVLSFGIKAAFSTPVITSDGEVIATVSLYYNTPYGPTEWDFEIVEVAANLMAIAVERKKQEDLILEQSIKLVSSSKLAAIGEMAANLAHEINNPLAIIQNHLTYLKILANKSELNPDDVLSAAKEIEKTVCRMTSIVKGLKTISKDSENDPVQEVNVKNLIEETLVYCESRFKKHDIALLVDPVPSHLTIRGKSVQLSQALLNLISNAFDAIKNSDDRWVRIGVEILDGEVILHVTDSGNGIPGEIKKKIMDPFFTTKGLSDGTGLGLSISRKIIESHRGKLLINETSLNTRFDIHLPVELTC